MDTFAIRRTRLKHLIDTLTQGNVTLFAARFGYSPAQIFQYMSSTYNEGRSMGERAARALEKKVGAPQGFLDQPIEPLKPNYPRAAAALEERDEKDLAGKLILRQIPVRFTGFVEESGSVKLEPTPENGEDSFVEFVSQSSDAYAIQVKGNMLKPRIRSNEYLILEPSKEPAPGDDVLVKFITEEFVILQFLYMRGTEWTFGPVNEVGPNVSCDESEIVSASIISAVLRSPR